MRLRRLDLTRYGKFTNHTIDFGEKVVDGPDFHVIYGLNEAGKSTTLSGFLDLLFGIEERSRYGFLHQYAAMEVGAVLELEGKRHEVRRVKQRTGSLRDAAGQPVAEALVAGPLAGLGREAYRMMFSLDDQTLEDGGNAILESKGDLGELLFSASAGLSGLSRALTDVAGEAGEIFRKRASSTGIAVLKRRLGELKDAKESIDIQAGAHAALVSGLKRAQTAYDEAVAERGKLKARQDELGRLFRAAPLATEHARLDADLSGMADLPRPPSHWAADLPKLMIDDATLSLRLRGQEERIQRLKAETDGIVIDGAVLRMADRINALPSLSARFQTAAADLPKRRAALVESRSRLARLARSVTGSEGEIDVDTLVVDAAVLGVLRSLIEEWSGIETTLSATQSELKNALLACDRATEERELLERDSPPLGAARKATLQALVNHIKDADVTARSRLTAANAGAKARVVEDALHRLAPWSGGPDQLEQLVLPSPRQIQNWRDALASQALRIRQHRDERGRLETERAELEARIVAAVTIAGSIGDEEATALRAKRDDTWSDHERRLDADSAAAFERAMRDVDTISDARLANADRLSDLRGLQRDLGLCRARIAREIELRVEMEREAAETAAAIEAACPVEIAGIRTEPLAEWIAGLEDWITQRDRAVVALGEHRAARSEAQAVIAEMEREGGRLGHALTSAGLLADGLDVAALLLAAEALLAADTSQAQSRAAADKAVREAGKILDGRRKAAQEAAERRQTWEDRWTQALANTWLANGATDRDSVRTIVDAVTGLPAQITERDGILYRISAMEADQEVFLAELRDLYMGLGESLDEVATSSAAAALVERLSAASQASASRRDKEAEIASLEDEGRALLSEISLHDAQRTKVAAFFGLEDLVEASACLDRCARRDRLEEEREKLAAQIMRETASASMASALEHLAATDADERATAYAEGSSRIEDLDERLRSLYAARSAAADKLAAVGRRRCGGAHRSRAPHGHASDRRQGDAIPPPADGWASGRARVAALS